MSRQRKNKEPYYTKQNIMDTYGLPPDVIDQYFPAPETRRISRGKNRKGYFYLQFWKESEVARALDFPEVKRALDKAKRRLEKETKRQEELYRYLESFDIDQFRKQAESLDRHFVLHIGPTNSGKTYSAIQALKAAKSGCYLGPLRLLALEMYEDLNADGFYCSLLTGEEYIEVPEAEYVASTIELCDFDREVEVAIIDEAQMVTDRERGDRWLKAIYLVPAKEVHICIAPAAEQLITEILSGFNAPFEIVRHERLTPLSFAGTFEDFKDACAGDAFIVFSRRAVLSVAATLEKQGIKASVIYGALPPVSRKEEIRKFENRETTVVVATDAIGMGVSLPIRRIIFCEAAKYDGVRTRPLRSDEIKQIAGRAGRFGIYDEGFVLTMAEPELIEKGMAKEDRQLTALTIPFPEECLDSGYKINDLLEAWQNLPKVPGIYRANMADALKIHRLLNKHMKKGQKRLVYKLITCPFDCEDPALLAYWYACSLCILKSESLPEPESGTDTLEECEHRYRELDIRHQLLRVIGIEDGRMDEKLELCRRINEFLEQDKNAYIRVCRYCGRILPPTYRYNVCEKCFQRRIHR